MRDAFGNFGRHSIAAPVGEQMKTEQESYSRYQDAVQMKAICNRKPPELVRKGADVWNPGETVLLHQVFEAMDEEGNQLDIQVLDIQDAETVGWNGMTKQAIRQCF